MSNDFASAPSYSQLMSEQRPFVTVNLDLSSPIELDDFVGFFGALSGEFDRYMREEFPDAAPEARFYVKDVRKGSIIADLFPGGLSDVIALMDNALIVTGFAALVGRVVLGYAKGEWKEGATKAELKDLYQTVDAIAKDRDGKATLETVTYEKGVMKRRVAFTFTSDEAREAAKNIEAHKQHLDRVDRSDYERVLMYFRRSDTGDVSVGKPSGERVVIEEIASRALSLSYASGLSEERIKDVIRNSPTNIYHLGFIVDVNVQHKGGKPVTYSVTHVHDILDLPSEDEG